MNINQNSIIFLDFEITIKSKKIINIGLVYKEKKFKTSSPKKIANVMKLCQAKYICGHNFVDFDLEMIKDTILYDAIKSYTIIDTLPLSLLLLNEKSLHALPKEYKSEDNFINDPVEDSKLTSELLLQLTKRFFALDEEMKIIFYSLLREKEHFKGFFAYLNDFTALKYIDNNSLHKSIITLYKNQITNLYHLQKTIESSPIELAYILALLAPHIEIKSHPPKILYTHKNIVEIQKKLCFNLEKLNSGLNDLAKDIFGFGTFRPFPKMNPTLLGSNQISQRDVIEASLRDESFLTVLPTGGGKTFTFWLPAIIKAKTYKGLTVVISPLQALIEDHIKNFNAKVANYKAVAISGYMSPLERSEAVEQVISGEADLLYLAPESLRSKAIFSILKNRYIERFVIDEAHCLSTWGNDFRQDYYYICNYITDLLDAKSFQEHIPISCFTATAKPSVIEDIKQFFKEGLDIELDEYIASPQRKNLQYKSIPSQSKDKYTKLLELIHKHDGSTLVYIPTSTKECDSVAQRLTMDTQKIVKSFHSKIESQEKMTILKDYISDDIDVIIATTAFGMGVDKSNITNVIHYEVSDSLESYAQEAGRGARDLNLNAFCPILYNESDLDRHFETLNRSKITASEINSIFRILKKSKGDLVNKTTFEIAKEAGWDVDDNANDYSTKVKTALLELEREGYISRKRNSINFFADSLAINSIELLHSKLEGSQFSAEEKERLQDILQSIIGQGKKDMVQIDELAHLLGYEKDTIALSIQQLKDMEILGSNKDLSLIVYTNSLKKFHSIKKIELELFITIQMAEFTQVTIKELNEILHQKGLITKSESLLIKDIIKNWRQKPNFIFSRINRQSDLWYFAFEDREKIGEKIDTTHLISEQILTIFAKEIQGKEKQKSIHFSLQSLYQETGKIHNIKDIDKTLLYLHQLGILQLQSGRFISYSPMVIAKEEKMKIKNKRYTLLDYKNRLFNHYQIKVESIHIMGEYAKILQNDSKKANSFLSDYFSMPYTKFKQRYKLLKEKITRPITQMRYEKIFAQMSPSQQAIIEDSETKAMMILAGPGSGKTKVLVHKIASLILTEDIKPEQFMMLTFSRTAVQEFRKRLMQLIGVLSYEIEISTFHSYALKLIGRNIKENDNTLNTAISEATRQLINNDIHLPFKRVLVLDEYQDISKESFEFVEAIYRTSNQEMRIIAVGDDDQCINEFAGADIGYIEKFEECFGEDEEGDNLFKQYELLSNYRSKQNIVGYSNNFINRVSKRYKKNVLIAQTKEDGIVNIYACSSNNLITPAINIVEASSKQEHIAILVFSNEAVMQIYSKLIEIGINAKFIIDRDKFQLKNIVEIVEFDKVLNSFLKYDPFYQREHFEEALKSIESRFEKSKNIHIVQKIIEKFLLENQNYYVTQWLSYLDEVTLEEFEDSSQRVTVSTIHKSKGMEFDKVIMLVQEIPKVDKKLRLYYVGMTRAKNELDILIRHNKPLENKPFSKSTFDDNLYPKDEKSKTFIMGLSDIYLGFTSNYKGDIIAGSDIKLEPRGQYHNLSIVYNNNSIGRLSKSFQNKIKSLWSDNYHIESARVDFVVLWYDKKENRYIRHTLCCIRLVKSS